LLRAEKPIKGKDIFGTDYTDATVNLRPPGPEKTEERRKDIFGTPVK